MFNSILEKLRSPTQPENQQLFSVMGPGRADQGRPDQEEDGFLLIGETASERNTILPAHHTPNSGYPPSYSQVEQSANNPVQPSSSRAWSSHLLSSPPPTSSPVGRSNQVDSQTGHSPTYANLVTEDIPFRLSEQLYFAQKLSTDTSYFAVPHLPSYNPTKYLYDFEEERRMLRETADTCD